MAWGICEWYGDMVTDMTAEERASAADDALAGGEVTQHGRLCPFVQHLEPGAVCNKKGGVCSIMPYSGEEPAPPASVCPRRLLDKDKSGKDIFDVLTQECFHVKSKSDYAVIREVPFLEKIDEKGQARGAKAGRIDWVLVANPEDNRPDWMAIETQAVYFSGASMNEDFEMYRRNPRQLHVTSKNRRPDWRSSGSKRLAPQLDAKSPVMSRWGRKVAVVVDEGFYSEFAAFEHDDVDFDNSEIVWVVISYDSLMNSSIRIERYAELKESITAIQATRPVRKAEFEADLGTHVADRTDKVHFKTLP